MNLFERFWNSIGELPGSCGAACASEVVVTPLPRPGGEKCAEAQRDLTILARRGVRRYPPSILTSGSGAGRPKCLIYTASGGHLPPFQELFEQYVDKNAFMAETFLRLKPHCHVPYVLFLGERCFYLFDARLEELLRWGDEFSALEELILQPLAAGMDLEAEWSLMPRKPLTQRSEEFARWLDLWKVAIGGRTNANPAFMQNLLQKILVLFLYDRRFGLTDPSLSLRANYLDARPAPPRRPGPLKKPAEAPGGAALVDVVAQAPKLRGDRSPGRKAPFDGVAWVHEAALELVADYNASFLQWNQSEEAFFSLLSGDARVLFSQFILDLFLLSEGKFEAAVQTDAFSDAASRMKLWKYAVTETLNVRSRLHADDVNVYEPVTVDLEDAGLGWAAHVVEQVLDFWRERCADYKRQLRKGHALPVQFDMFQQPDLAAARLPRPQEALQIALSTSIQIRYDFPAMRGTLEYLVLIHVLEFCRRWNLPLSAMGYIGEIFVQKERVAQVQEI